MSACQELCPRNFAEDGKHEVAKCSLKDRLIQNNFLKSQLEPVDTRNMTKGKSQEWQFLCLKALLEPLDSPHLSQLVKEAETAISQRLQELRVSANGSGGPEATPQIFP